MNLVLAFAMILSLITCPFRCLGGIADEDGLSSDVSSTHLCRCCSKDETRRADENQRPVPAPADDCECQCLCKGSVPSEEFHFALDVSSPALDGTVKDVLADLAAIASNTKVFSVKDGSAKGHALQNGQEIRICFDSFLI